MLSQKVKIQKEELTRFTSKFSWVWRTGSSGRGPACNSPRKGSRNTRTTRIILSVCDPNEVLILKPGENHSIHRTSTCRPCVQHHPQNQSNKTNRTKFFLSVYWLQPVAYVPFCFGWNTWQILLNYWIIFPQFSSLCKSQKGLIFSFCCCC